MASADNPLKRLVNLRSEHSWISSVVDAHLSKPHVSRADPGWFHPSSLAHPCDAYLAFAYLGVEGREKPTARLQRIFDNGNARDTDIKRYLHEVGASVIKRPEERKISLPAYRIRGEFDDRVRHPVGGETYVVEIKTMNTDQWQALKAPTPDHKVQIHPYAFATQDYRGIFIYEDKNTQEWKTFLQPFDWPLWNGLVARLEAILQGLRAGHVHRTPVANESSCPFYYMCSVANVPELVAQSGLQV